MLTSWKQHAASWGPGLALILPLLYVYQALPHEHHVPIHETTQSAQPLHATHTHDHQESPDSSAGGSERGHHHHAFTQHLESHLLRTTSERPDSAPKLLVQVSYLAIDDAEVSVEHEEPDPGDTLPDQIPIAPFDPRGPPRLI